MTDFYAQQQATPDLAKPPPSPPSKKMAFLGVMAIIAMKYVEQGQSAGEPMSILSLVLVLVGVAAMLKYCYDKFRYMAHQAQIQRGYQSR